MPPKKLNFKMILGSNLGPFWGQMAPKNPRVQISRDHSASLWDPKNL